jgi:uncharacterized membrane protein
MKGLSLQFQAAASVPLMVLLLAVIAAILLAAGAACLVRRQWRQGSAYLAAVAGPVGLAIWLVVDLLRCYAAGRAEAARPRILAAAVAGGVAVAAGLLVAASPQAFWMAAVGSEAAAAIAVFYAAAYGALGTRRLAALVALRLGAVAALLAVLFKPAIGVVVDPESLKPPLPVLVDRSGSMATADEPGGPTRLKRVIDALAANRGRLASAFHLRWRPFGKSVVQAASFDAAAAVLPSGAGSDGTDIALAIRQAAQEPARPRIPAVLLLSDGIHNGPGGAADAAAQAGVPVYVVGVGSASPEVAGARNIRLASIDAPLDVARDSEATIRAGLQIDGLASQPVEVRLSEEGGTAPLATATVTAPGPSAAVTAELTWTARAAAAEAGQATLAKLVVSAAVHPAEAVSEDNASPLHVLITDPRIGVLYVEGSVRPEYKFLKRLLDSDPQLSLATLVRVSGQRFSAAGRIAGRTVEAVPAREEDFRGIDVLILGDLDRSFLTDAQLAAIRRFVEGGGGLVMLGGASSFGPGGYGGTGIEQVLPVIVGGRDQPREPGEFLPVLTAAGVAHPVTAGLERFLPSPGHPAAAADLPPLGGCVTFVAAKPAAEVLAVHPTRRNAAGPLVILAVQQVGAGRTAAFAADTTWRWDLPLRAMGADSPYPRFWGQLVRYLASAEVKTRRAKPAVVLRPQRTYLQPGESTSLTVRALGEGGLGLEPSRVRCTLTGPTEGSTATLPLTPGSSLGVLVGRIDPQPPGRYTLRAVAMDAAGAQIAADEMPLGVGGQSGETERLARDDALLRRVAEQSGGQVADLSALGQLVDQLIDRYRNPAADRPFGRTYRLYHFPLLLAAFVVLLTVEWVLRRRWQLR